MSEGSRIAELRRRVDADPASIAFAQLAEEYRRAGEYDEAVKYCRLGLTRHPGYLSARVTLGRALLQLGKRDDAAHEFELVLQSAPDNLAAIRGMAEIHEARGAMSSALQYYKQALALARFDPKLEATVDRMDRVVAGVADDEPQPERGHVELLSAAKRGEETPLDVRGTSSVFDDLLAALGTPQASPPPATERLFSDVSPPEMPRQPIVPDAPPNTGSDDVFAQLEQELRAFEGAKNATTDDTILDELERWLREVVATRANASSP